MQNQLLFCEANYTVETLELEGKSLVYRAYEGIPYVTNPADAKIQTLNIFVPEIFYEGGSVGPYHLKNAPIFFPNTVGGYMPGPCERPGRDSRGRINASFEALRHGYVVVSPGVRGRGMKDDAGRCIGTAPAAICDLKAAVRFLRHNAHKIPGDVDRIISNGTSAGGALSALLGTTGNHPDFEPFLQAMGAAEEKDNIFAASCYCPITNLDHADMAYEWEFCGLNEYHNMKFEPPGPGEDRPRITPADGVMTEKQKQLSLELKTLFPAYLNSLNLKDEEGHDLTLDTNGNGSFKEYVQAIAAASAQKELDRGTDLSKFSWLSIEEGKVKDIHFDGYTAFRTRMKETPAFDHTVMGTPENELFGTEDIPCRHFTEYSKMHSEVSGELADAQQIKMMNPMNYIEDKKAVKAKYVRIRHGSVDRDTSLAVSAMLNVKLKNNGVEAQLEYPWGIPHAGDYDLEELFAWIDKICGEIEK